MGISDAWVIVAGTSTVLAIGVGFLRARKFVEDRIQEALSKDEVIQKLSMLVKPDLIFDEKGSIISDRGASLLLKDTGIQISMGVFMGNPVPSEIRISFTKHLKTPPLITPLNPDAIFIYPRRGESHDWIYKLNYTGLDTPDDKSAYNKTFRLEIM